MTYVFTHAGRRRHLRALALLAVLVGACNAENLGNSDPPAVTTTPDGVTGGDVTPDFVTNSYTGIPYGPFGLMSSYTSFYWGPAPFTSSQNSDSPSGIVTRINAARWKRQRIVIAMTGGPSTNYTTDGKFSLTKWKNRMNLFKTTAIKQAVAAGVADGTIIGNAMIDEPETVRWGGVLTKPLLDQMAAYAKAIFPTLPQGVNHGATGYTWRRSEHYRVVDYVLNQYGWNITKGDVGAWLSAVRAQFSTDRVKLGFSINVLNGGVKKIGCFSGSACCPLSTTGGVGTYVGAAGVNCRMTATQVRNYGQTLGVAACMLLVWKYDYAFMAKSANLQAFRDVGYTVGSKPRPSCRRA